MQRTDRWLGLALTLLAGLVIVSARSFPSVPGQKLGAGFLPTLVGCGLLVCGLALVLRSLRGRSAAATERQAERVGSALLVIAVVVAYIGLADRIGFLLLAPPCLFLLFKAFRVRSSTALAWAVGGSLLVHLAFYKLLRVPLPWGLLRPFY